MPPPITRTEAGPPSPPLRLATSSRKVPLPWVSSCSEWSTRPQADEAAESLADGYWSQTTVLFPGSEELGASQVGGNRFRGGSSVTSGWVPSSLFSLSAYTKS